MRHLTETSTIALARSIAEAMVGILASTTDTLWCLTKGDQPMTVCETLAFALTKGANVPDALAEEFFSLDLPTTPDARTAAHQWIDDVVAAAAGQST